MYTGGAHAQFTTGAVSNNDQEGLGVRTGVISSKGNMINNTHQPYMSHSHQTTMPSNIYNQNMTHSPANVVPGGAISSMSYRTPGATNGSPMLNTLPRPPMMQTPATTSTPLSGNQRTVNPPPPPRPVIVSSSPHQQTVSFNPVQDRFPGPPSSVVGHPVASGGPAPSSVFQYSNVQDVLASGQVHRSSSHKDFQAVNSPGSLQPGAHHTGALSSPGYLLHNSSGDTRRSVSDAGNEWDIKVVVRNKEGERRQVLTFLLQDRINPVDHNKEIYIQITDRQDPMLFYSLCIAEEDFQNVKSSNGLLVDFASFPGMLRQLLDKCEKEGESDAPSFILILNLGLDTSTLDFTELNLFKHLCHLSLIIIKATDSKLKEYLVSCIQQLKSDLNTTSCQLTLSQQELADKQTKVDEQLQQLEAVRREQQETSSSLGQKLVAELQQEKEACTKKINDLQSRFEVERRELEARHARSLDQLENRVASLDVQNRDLLEGKYRNESNIRELRGKLAAKEEEFKRLETDFHSLSRDKGLTDVRNRDEARRVSDLQKQVSSLEQEVRDKDQEVARCRQEVTNIEKEKEDIVADLKEKMNTVTRREAAVRSVTEELIKANEIIRKLQDQLKQEQNKSKLRGKIASEQEKLLSDKDKDLQDVTEKLRKSELAQVSAIKEKDDEIVRIKKLEEEKEELEKLNKSNENVINWLNKQLASFKSADANIGMTRGGVTSRVKTGRPGATSRKSTSDVNYDSSKENEPLVGLDPKYFEVSTPGGTVTRNEIPDVRQLPSNIKRTGGLLRR